MSVTRLTQYFGDQSPRAVVVTQDDGSTVVVWNPGEFWDLFTPTEQAAFLAGAAASPLLSALLVRMQTRSVLHSDSAELRAGLLQVSEAGILTAERVDQILGGA